MSEISVIIPVRNGATYVAEAIRSVIAQDIEAEIIVVDDSSTDDTPEIVLGFPHVTLLTSSLGGAGNARNTGLAACTTPFVKFLDADDVLVPGCLARQLVQIERCDSQELPFGDVSVLSHGRLTAVKMKRIVEAATSTEQIVGLIIESIPTSAPLHRLELLKRVSGFDGRLKSRQEWNLHLRLATAGAQFRYFEGPVYIQRDHGDAQRITNRKMVGKDELRNLITALEPLRNIQNDEVKRAIAAYVWCVGRQFALRSDTRSAQAFFDLARTSADSNFMKLLPTKYRWLSRFVGPTLPDQFIGAWIRFKRRAGVATMRATS